MKGRRTKRLAVGVSNSEQAAELANESPRCREVSNERGEPPYEKGPFVAVRAGTNEVTLTRNGHDLEASTGVCLVIGVYARRTKTGCIIHLQWTETLWAPDEELLRKPFEAHPELCDAPAVALISSKEVTRKFGQQLASAEEAIRSLAPNASFRHVTLVDNPELTFDPDLESMAADVFLETQTRRLVVNDAYGPQQAVAPTYESGWPTMLAPSALTPCVLSRLYRGSLRSNSSPSRWNWLSVRPFKASTVDVTIRAWPERTREGSAQCPQS